MTEGEVGDRYAELGGQLPDEPERERGKRRIEALREKLKDTPCDSCGHSLQRYHGPSGACYHPLAPRGEDCPCGHESETT